MYIAYTLARNPNEEVIYDTRKSRNSSLGLLRTLGEVPTQTEWDQEELALLAEDQKRGRILDYRVVEG